MNTSIGILAPKTEENQNFSKEEMTAARKKLFVEAVDSIISENLEALKELAK
jgi:hypothetical protein